MSDKSIQTVDLPSHFTQPQLAGLKDLVNHHRDNGHGVRFDAKEVERIDGAAVQFIVAVCKLQSEIYDHCLVVSPNDVMLKAFDDMGVQEHISMDEAEVESLAANHNA